MISPLMRSLRLMSRRQLSVSAMFAVGGVLLAGLDLLAILLVGVAVAVGFGASTLPFDIRLAGMDAGGSLFFLLALSGLLFVLKSIGGLLLARRRAQFLANLEVDFSDLIARKVFAEDLSQFRTYSRADLEWAILRSSSIAFGRLVGKGLSLLAELAVTLAVLTIFFVMDWATAIGVTAYIGGIALIFQLFTRRRTRTAGQLYSSGSISVMEAVTDLANVLREARVMGASEFLLTKIRDARASSATHNAYYEYISAVPRLIVELGLIAGALGFFGFQYWYSGGDIDWAIISVFIAGSLRIMSALLPIQSAIQELRFHAGQAAGAQEILEGALPQASHGTKEKIPTRECDSVAISGPLDIDLVDVSFFHSDEGDASPSVDGISLRIRAGQTAAIIGPSGAGKSTLVDLITGMYEPARGTVRLSGESPQDLCRLRPGLIGYVPQKPGLISGTVAENIALGVEPAEISRERLQAAIGSAQLADVIASLPLREDATLGKQSDGLSGGQLQRLGLARSLYFEPGLVVLDEATSALDPETESMVGLNLRNLPGGPTVLVVAHRLSTIQKADIVFVLDEGKLIAQGALTDLMERVPLVSRFVNLMAISDEEVSRFD